MYSPTVLKMFVKSAWRPNLSIKTSLKSKQCGLYQKDCKLRLVSFDTDSTGRTLQTRAKGHFPLLGGIFHKVYGIAV